MELVKRLALILDEQKICLPEGAEYIELYREELEILVQGQDGSEDYEYVLLDHRFPLYGEEIGQVEVEELNEFLKTNPNFYEDHQTELQEAVVRLKDLGVVVSVYLAEGKKLAENLGISWKFDMPDGSEVDVSKLDRVDWYSSSFNC